MSRRTKALKKLEFAMIQREATFYEKLFELEKQFQEEIAPFEQKVGPIFDDVRKYRQNVSK